MDAFTVVVGSIQLVMAGLGVYMSLRPPKEKWHWYFLGAFITLGLVGVIFNGIQGSESKKAAERSDKEIIELKSQITQLFNANKIAATTDDMNKLSFEMGRGFSRVISAINGGPVTSQPQRNNDVTPTIEDTRLLQKPTISNDANLPYGLQVIIQSNVAIQPVAFGFKCSGGIGSVNAFIPGEGVYLNESVGVATQDSSIAVVRFSFPSLKPENSLVVTIFSKTQVRVVQAFKLNP